MILVIDNYDSFVHNLARYFHQLGCPTEVVRNDKINVDQVTKLNPAGIVISPGPCTPDQAGCSIALVKQFSATVPVLGICLGHQVIVQAFGGSIVLANEPVHGRQSVVHHTGSRMFESIPSRFVAGRYHSLVADTGKLPSEFKATARTDDGTVMAVEHETLPVVGLQFHPESILTECGYRLLINFMNISGIPVEPSRLNDPIQSEQDSLANCLLEKPLRSSRLSTRSPLETNAGRKPNDS